MPRRPARPVSWVYSPGVRNSWRSPVNFDSFSTTTVLAGGVVAGGPAEDEVDGGQHGLVVEALDHLGPPRGVQPGAGPAPQARRRRRVEPGRFGIGTPGVEGGQQVQGLRVAVADEIEVVEIDRTSLLDHSRGRAPNGLDPFGHLLGVG